MCFRSIWLQRQQREICWRYYTSWIIVCRQLLLLVVVWRGGKMRMISATETDLHWMSRDANTAVGPTVHERVAVMRAIISPPPPYLDRLTQFILHSSAAPSRARLQIGRAVVPSRARHLFSNSISSSCCTAAQFSQLTTTFRTSATDIKIACRSVSELWKNNWSECTTFYWWYYYIQCRW